MSLPTMLLRQDGGRSLHATAEGGSVMAAALLLDIPERRCPIDQLEAYDKPLRAGAMPVGSVEFVREAMRVGGICEPTPLSYPLQLDAFLGRRVDIATIDDLRGRMFIKPVCTKLFSGFVYQQGARDADYSEHDLEQLRVVRSLQRGTPIWVCEPVTFVSEWRYYVLGGRIVGQARYDPDGADDAAEPSTPVVEAAVATMSAIPDCPAAYAIDMGVLDDGRTVMVEANDAFALGLYGRALEPKVYLGLLAARWAQIRDAT